MEWYKIPTGTKLQPFTFIVGGRGIGKSYSAIDTAINEYPGAFLYIRNTEVQLKESCSAFGNPFKRWAKDHDRDIFVKMEGQHAIVYECPDKENQKNKTTLGYAAALSTFENLRSVDLSDVNFIIFEEFIENRTMMFDQFGAFKHMYETVNRNRELFGEEPVKVVFLSNAQRLGNAILRGYNLIPVIESMMKSGQRTATIGNKRIELPFSAVSEAKAKTALYQDSDDKFIEQALHNKFSNDSFTGVKKVNINEYTPIVAIDGIYIYRHKSEPIFYACSIKAKCKEYRSLDNFIVFYRCYGLKLKLAAAEDKLFYADYTTKCDLLDRLKMLY